MLGNRIAAIIRSTVILFGSILITKTITEGEADVPGKKEVQTMEDTVLCDYCHRFMCQ